MVYYMRIDMVVVVHERVCMCVGFKKLSLAIVVVPYRNVKKGQGVVYICYNLLITVCTRS